MTAINVIVIAYIWPFRISPDPENPMPWYYPFVCTCLRKRSETQEQKEEAENAPSTALLARQSEIDKIKHTQLVEKTILDPQTMYGKPPVDTPIDSTNPVPVIKRVAALKNKAVTIIKMINIASAKEAEAK